jgi:3-hydroxybutyryl-CoA dehydrogenase
LYWWQHLVDKLLIYLQKICMQQHSIAVCGAGTMGAGIAQVAAINGFTTILFDVHETAVQKGKLQIENAIQLLVQKGKITQQQASNSLQNISYTHTIQQVKATCIIEAIIEKLEAKIGLLQQLMQQNGEHTIYATNTSSISIEAIAKPLLYKEQVIGIHFFNPATVMRLVEIIKSPFTSQTVIKQSQEIVEALQKTTVLCNDFPGFIVNRVARHFYLESMYLAENNIADINTIDAALQNAGFKMGPFALMDLIGLDINYNVSNIVYNDLGKPERLTPSSLQLQKVQAGKLGKKTGEGFYTY